MWYRVGTWLVFLFFSIFIIDIFSRWYNNLGFPGGSDGKDSSCQAGEVGSIPGSGRSPEKEWQEKELRHIPVILPGEFHGHRSLAGPWGRKRVGHDLVDSTTTTITLGCLICRSCRSFPLN